MSYPHPSPATPLRPKELSRSTCVPPVFSHPSDLLPGAPSSLVLSIICIVKTNHTKRSKSSRSRTEVSKRASPAMPVRDVSSLFSLSLPRKLFTEHPSMCPVSFLFPLPEQYLPNTLHAGGVGGRGRGVGGPTALRCCTTSLQARRAHHPPTTYVRPCLRCSRVFFQAVPFFELSSCELRSFAKSSGSHPASPILRCAHQPPPPTTTLTIHQQ